MKKYLALISSIITILVCIIAQTINQIVEYNVSMTYNGTASLISKVFILLCVGICIGWNIWILCKNTKQHLTIMVSILLNIVVVIIYFWRLNQIFLYPIVLVGIYVFLYIEQIKHREN